MRSIDAKNILNDDNLSWLKEIIDDSRIEIIVAFGSYLKNKKNAKDIDILIISDKFKFENFHERIDLFTPPKSKYYYDIFCYTREEFIEIFNRHPFIENIKKIYLTLKGDIDELFRFTEIL
jgi:predicted nucleotidyltransferase